MSYTALYRKLRPTLFQDVIGQNFIIKTLVNQIQTDRISHAYLFCGTRGTGKTSVAKIFAKAINCTSRNDGEPCTNCEVCLSIAQNRNLNVSEIDAASNNGVENIRDIREDVKYPPTLGKYKIYIIDEVHMLSTGAFNALLKTLEEPPAHVIFILATTDPQKIPPTILSRCQRFDFKRILSSDMFDALKQHTLNENIDIEDSALKYITKISDGAMRDALSLLDMSTSFYFGNTITYKNILDLVGSVDNRILSEMAYALNDFNSSKVIELINEIIISGRDITQFTNELLLHFRNILISMSISNTSNALDYSIENILLLKEQGEKIGNEKLFLYINTFSELQNQMKYASNLRILLEVTCIKLCTLSIDDDSNSLIIRLKKLEDSIQNNSFKIINSQDTAIQKEMLENKELITPSQVQSFIKPKTVPDYIKDLRKNWESFYKDFNPIIKSILKLSELGFIDDNSDNTILLVIKDNSSVDLLKDKKHFDIIKEKFHAQLNKEINVKLICKKDYDKSHIKNYGTIDNDLEQFKNFTDKINMDIITE